MRWRISARLEIVRRSHQTAAKMMLPNPVHDDPASQRIGGIDDCARQAQAPLAVGETDRISAQKHERFARFCLLQQAMARGGALPLVLDLDQHFSPVGILRQEVDAVVFDASDPGLLSLSTISKIVVWRPCLQNSAWKSANQLAGAFNRRLRASQISQSHWSACCAPPQALTERQFADELIAFHAGDFGDSGLPIHLHADAGVLMAAAVDEHFVIVAGMVAPRRAALHLFQVTQVENTRHFEVWLEKRATPDFSAWWAGSGSRPPASTW